MIIISFGSLPSWLIFPMPSIDPMLKDLSTFGNNSKLQFYAIIDQWLANNKP
jgi:hypothetical protein